ncbi:hypothetical protein GR157_23940 [Burkholderia sp. 4701]|nr:hypothetical protein [Burkholderia sp. 4701]MXN84968.1 hypothetical protein [Burkholderia sp. 4812]
MTPYVASAITGGDPNVTSGQAAAIAAFATFAGGTLAGLAGQNAAAGALAAQNEAINNCLGHPQSCTQLLKNWGVLPSQGAANIGLAGSATIPYTGLSFSAGVGALADARGNVGLYWSAGPGKGVGGDISAGINVGAYPGASTIQDYGGWFNNASAGVGLGEHLSVDVFQDPTKNPGNAKGYGGSVTYGFGIGGGASVSRTYTGIVPIYKP